MSSQPAVYPPIDPGALQVPPHEGLAKRRGFLLRASLAPPSSVPSRYSATSPKALRFVDEYLVDLCGAAAARRAGYSETRANKVASDLLTMPAIQARIEAAQAKRAARTGIEADRVLEELALLAFSDIDHYTIDAETGRVTLADGAPKGAKRALASVKFRVSQTGERTTELRFWDKNAAIGNAMKHLGMLTDKVELTGKNGGPIAHAITVRFVRPAASGDA